MGTQGGCMQHFAGRRGDVGKLQKPRKSAVPVGTVADFAPLTTAQRPCRTSAQKKNIIDVTVMLIVFVIVLPPPPPWSAI